MKKSLVLIPLIILNVSVITAQDSPLLNSWRHYLDKKIRSQFDLPWISLGPVANSARVEAVQADPARPGTFYVAFGSGNLWKTTDHGLFWKPIFENQPALGIGDIALAPSDPGIIYLGTGESLKKPRNFTLPGVGVFRSDDGGETWRHLGLTDSYHIGEIAIHPTNPDIAFVAVLGHFWSTNTNRGLYRTRDGGKSWDKVLYINEKTGANDVVISPADPNRVYVSMWENNPGIAGQESAVYASIDGGTTWSKKTVGFASGPQTGRIGLAVSWQNPDKVYALVDNLNKEKSLAAECYLSEDGGDTWIRTHKEELLIFPGIGWYFTDCYVNPQDDQEVYLLGVRLAHSTDGGKTFELVGGNVMHMNPSPAVPLHLDHCEMWINPLHPEQLLLGNDGGVYISYNKGTSWMHYNNIPAGEFYDISVDNEVPYRVFGGVQDNASVYGPSREWNPRFPDRWEYIWIDAWSGGDGCVTWPDPVNPDRVFTSSQNGGIFRMDLRQGKHTGIQPRLPRGDNRSLSYNFVAPYIISGHHPSTLYHGGNYIFKTTNSGDDWTLISPDLSRSTDPLKNSVAAGAIAESPVTPGLLYVGTDRGAFWVTKNDGVTWLERSTGLPPAYIRSISASGFSDQRVYVALTGINYDDLQKHLYVSENQGEDWTKISGDLPDEVVNCILEDPRHENLLYAGTMRGVYISVNRGDSWSLLGPSMAPTCISDLVIQEHEEDLVAGTHGRGIYKLDLTPIYEWLIEGVTDGSKPKAHLFSIPVLEAPWYNTTHRDPDPRTVQKITFSWWQPESETVTLTILDKNKKIWSTSIEAHSGFNFYRWDGVIQRQSSMHPYFIHYEVYLTPGEYLATLKGKKSIGSQPLQVVPAVFSE